MMSFRNLNLMLIEDAHLTILSLPIIIIIKKPTNHSRERQDATNLND